MFRIKLPYYNFIGSRNIAFFISGVLLLLSVVMLGVRKGFNISVDFAGGTVVSLRFEKPVAADLDKIRSIVSGLGYRGAEIKTIGREADHEVQISLKKKGAEGALIADEIRTALEKDYSGNPFEVRNTEEVGPRIGRTLLRNAVFACLFSALAIIAYMALRFNLPFGIAAIVAEIHDILIALGALLFINAELSLTSIAAILTILGYSLNDTIVVFDRIRENLAQTHLRRSFEDRVNDSINQTMGRTMLTSITTLVAILIMLVVFSSRNETIRNFCFTMAVGVVSGTYSSIFIASPILVLWNKKWPIGK